MKTRDDIYKTRKDTKEPAVRGGERRRSDLASGERMELKTRRPKEKKRFCLHCGHQIPSASVTSRCPKCGTEL